MAKISLTKLKLDKTIQDKVISATVNDCELTIKQYLPINRKLELIEQVINQTIEGQGFFNPVKLDVFAQLAIVQYYTDIALTDKQKEDFCKTYDLLESNGIITAIINAIPTDEYTFLIDSIQECAENIVTFNNSVVGVLSRVSADYNNLNLDVDQIMSVISDPEQLKMVKSLATNI